MDKKTDPSVYLARNDINHPRNALFMSSPTHVLFGSFRISIQHLNGIYILRSFVPTVQVPIALRKWIDQPLTGLHRGVQATEETKLSPTLCDIHFAVARILHLCVGHGKFERL